MAALGVFIKPSVAMATNRVADDRRAEAGTTALCNCTDSVRVFLVAST